MVPFAANKSSALWIAPARLLCRLVAHRRRRGCVCLVAAFFLLVGILGREGGRLVQSCRYPARCRGRVVRSRRYRRRSRRERLQVVCLIFSLSV